MGRFEHITPALRDVLHWLPVDQRVLYKIALLTFKCLHGCAPQYLSEHCITLHDQGGRYQLRAATRGDLAQTVAFLSWIPIQDKDATVWASEFSLVSTHCLELPTC